MPKATTAIFCLMLLAIACAAPPPIASPSAAPASAEQLQPQASESAWREVGVVSSARGEHDGLAAPLQAMAQDAAAPQPWSYRVYLPIEDTAGTADKRPLILLNLLASIEWDADDAYLRDFETALRKASFYLWDLTDGQMAIGQAHVVDNRESWKHADIRVLARNTEAPHASINGMGEQKAPAAYRVQVGPFWSKNLNTDPTGKWSAPDGYRTLAHELLHYVVGLYDEYNLGTNSYSGCSAAPPDDSRGSGASAMNWQYTASELSATTVPKLWSNECEKTLQWEKTKRGKSAWASVAARFNTSPTSIWRIYPPNGTADPGPDCADWPAALADIPVIISDNKKPAPLLTDVSVQVTGKPVNEAADVFLARPGQCAISLGKTVVGDGALQLLGAHPDDIFYVKYQFPRDASVWWCGTATLSAGNAVTVTIELNNWNNLCPFRFSSCTDASPVTDPSQARVLTLRPSAATGGETVLSIEIGPEWPPSAEVEPIAQSWQLEPFDSPQWAVDVAAALAEQDDPYALFGSVGLCLPDGGPCTLLPIGVAGYIGTEEQDAASPLTYSAADGRLQVYDRADPDKIQSLLILDSSPPSPFRGLRSISRAYTLAGDWTFPLQVQIQAECCLDAEPETTPLLFRLIDGEWVEAGRPPFSSQESYVLAEIAEPGTYGLFAPR